MITFIPIRKTEVLDKNVEKGILFQTIPTEIVLVENSPVSYEKRKGEFEGRNKIIEIAKEKYEFTIVNDSNIHHLFVDNYCCMWKCLNENLDIGAISLWYRDGGYRPETNKHIKQTCVMWRTNLLKKMPILTDYKFCCCHSYKETLDLLGYKIIYLDGTKRVEELN